MRPNAGLLRTENVSEIKPSFCFCNLGLISERSLCSNFMDDEQILIEIAEYVQCEKEVAASCCGDSPVTSRLQQQRFCVSMDIFLRPDAIVESCVSYGTTGAIKIFEKETLEKLTVSMNTSLSLWILQRSKGLLYR
jgi:hypothetical protein